jgi:RHS repeat-associated protein
MGRIEQYTDPVSGINSTFAYNDKGRKLQEVVNYGSFTAKHDYTYYANGQIETYTGPDNILHTYTYDGAARLASIDIAGVGPITVNEYTWNSPKTLTFPGGTTRNFEFTPEMQPETIQGSDPAGNPVQDYSYLYSLSGNVTGLTTSDGATTYDYDNVYRLESATGPAADTIDDEAFTYDALGNRLTSLEAVGSITYNADNQIEGYSTASGSVSFQYDNAGNLKQKSTPSGTWDYLYNAAGRLVEVQLDTVTKATYGYDPFGRRLWKNVVGDATTYFHYSDEGLVAEFNGSGTLTKSYGYMPGSMWSTDPLYMATDEEAGKGWSYYWYHNDHLGTPKYMTDTSGAIVWAAVAEAYGATQVQISSVTNNLRFPGQYQDGESGLHYNYHRYYDPATGGYNRLDPLRDSLNWYGYVGGNPVVNMDPLGLKYAEMYGNYGAAGGAFAGAVASGVLDVGTGGINIPLTAAEIAFTSAIGYGAGYLLGSFVDYLDDYFNDGFGGYSCFAKPPSDARNPDGPKAPGKPTAEEGYRDPKGGEKWVTNPNGRGSGWLDDKGRVWVPTGPGGSAHGGPHWDVQTPGKGGRRGPHDNIYPGGRVR